MVLRWRQYSNSFLSDNGVKRYRIIHRQRSSSASAKLANLALWPPAAPRTSIVQLVPLTEAVLYRATSVAGGTPFALRRYTPALVVCPDRHGRWWAGCPASCRCQSVAMKHRAPWRHRAWDRTRDAHGCRCGCQGRTDPAHARLSMLLARPDGRHDHKHMVVPTAACRVAESPATLPAPKRGTPKYTASCKLAARRKKLKGPSSWPLLSCR
jgi:hypothetical protein